MGQNKPREGTPEESEDRLYPLVSDYLQRDTQARTKGTLRRGRGVKFKMDGGAKWPA
jgi:hypothetical protein